MNNTRSFDFGSLVIGILFILVSLMAFANPGSSLAAIVVFFGLMAIISGGFSVYARSALKNVTGIKSTGLLVFGILEIIVGVVLLFNINAGITVLPFIFAIWFIVSSIKNLFLLDEAKLISTGYYWFSLIINVLGVIIGFMLFFDPITSALTLAFLVGFYLMLAGILYIVNAFSR